MTSKNKNGSLNAEAQKFSNINSHWHLSYLRLKKNLQKKGFITFQAIEKLNKKQIITEAIKQGCDCYFFDNDIHKVK